MSKEVFVREKPHVNIGRIGCGVLLAVGVISVMVIPRLNPDQPPEPVQPTTDLTNAQPSETATSTLPDIELP